MDIHDSVSGSDQIVRARAMHRTHTVVVDQLIPHSGSYGNILFCGCPGLLLRQDGGLEFSEDSLGDFADRLQTENTLHYVPLMADSELPEIEMSDIYDVLAASGMVVHRVHLPDYSVPNAVFERVWSQLSGELVSSLVRGHSVAVQCLAGCGRSPLIAGCLLGDLGIPAKDAVRVIRDLEPEAIETAEQEQYLKDYCIRSTNQIIQRS